MMGTSRMPAVAVAVAGGSVLIGLAANLPWAYVSGRPVGLDWVGL